MSIDGLRIIGERINPGFKSSRALIEARDLAGLQELARSQTAKGATWLTINVGNDAERDPNFMIDTIKAVQAVTDLPLSIDSPSAAVQEACLAAYDTSLSAGKLPIMNSVAEGRWEMFALRKQVPCTVLFMASERFENGKAIANRSAAEVHATARRLIARAKADDPSINIDDCIVDVSIGPMASDTENLTRTAVESVRMIGSDPELAGVHLCVGLSNLSIMLPKEAADGGLLRTRLESAFLTETVPYGLDTILGTPGRNYELLPDEDFVLQGFRRTIAADGFDALMSLRDLYAA
ncbi:MAG: dihydropteroate synthase [Planctomycetota bacterium]|jgi:5-methyltetrahydrofolate--homocysteine methyltransferase|nr:dihydropteroate synthase [Planctomycetota bacterium]